MIKQKNHSMMSLNGFIEVFVIKATFKFELLDLIIDLTIKKREIEETKIEHQRDEECQIKFFFEIYFY